MDPPTRSYIGLGNPVRGTGRTIGVIFESGEGYASRKPRWRRQTWPSRAGVYLDPGGRSESTHTTVATRDGERIFGERERERERAGERNGTSKVGRGLHFDRVLNLGKS